jgi:hypothetical protein
MKIKCVRVECVSSITIGSNPTKVPIRESYDDILRVGEIYTVYAQSIWAGVVGYLIDVPFHGKTNPEWVRAELFDVLDNSLPQGIFFQYYGLDDKRGVQALWGYRELIFDPYHYDKLIDADDDAIKVFVIHKREIDNNS